MLIEIDKSIHSVWSNEYIENISIVTWSEWIVYRFENSKDQKRFSSEKEVEGNKSKIFYTLHICKVHLSTAASPNMLIGPRNYREGRKSLSFRLCLVSMQLTLHSQRRNLSLDKVYGETIIAARLSQDRRFELTRQMKSCFLLSKPSFTQLCEYCQNPCNGC